MFWNVRAMPRRVISFRLRPAIDLPGEAHVAIRRLEDAGDDVEDRRLARAVRPDQPEDLAAIDVKVDGVEGSHAAEAHRQPGEIEQRLSHRGDPPARVREG